MFRVSLVVTTTGSDDIINVRGVTRGDYESGLRWSVENEGLSAAELVDDGEDTRFVRGECDGGLCEGGVEGDRTGEDGDICD